MTYCQTCRVCRRIIGDPEELLWMFTGVPEWESSFPCITPLCGGRATLTKVNPGEKEAHQVPAQVYFRAIMGFGGPSGEGASIDRLRELLSSQKIVRVNGYDTGNPERVILNSVSLENGTKLHFAASSKGACIHYIEEPQPSCLEVFDERESSSRSSEVDDQDREEMRRDPEAGQGGESGCCCPAPELRRAGMPAVPEACDVPLGRNGGGSTA